MRVGAGSEEEEEEACGDDGSGGGRGPPAERQGEVLGEWRNVGAPYHLPPASFDSDVLPHSTTMCRSVALSPGCCVVHGIHACSHMSVLHQRMKGV
jgi:hypothetical protein